MDKSGSASAVDHVPTIGPPVSGNPVCTLTSQRVSTSLLGYSQTWHHRLMWRAIRWPIGAVVVSAALLALSFLLDFGGMWARGIALILGSSAMFLLLPASVIWLLVAVIIYEFGRRRG